MKKFLLIAAMAALAIGASADGYKIEKVWNLQNPKAVIGLDRLEIRQGFGMDGKIFINDKALLFQLYAVNRNTAIFYIFFNTSS